MMRWVLAECESRFVARLQSISETPTAEPTIETSLDMLSSQHHETKQLLEELRNVGETVIDKINASNARSASSCRNKYPVHAVRSIATQTKSQSANWVHGDIDQPNDRLSTTHIQPHLRIRQATSSTPPTQSPIQGAMYRDGDPQLKLDGHTIAKSSPLATPPPAERKK